MVNLGAIKSNFVSYKNKFNKKYGYGKNDSHSLSEIAKLSNIKLFALQRIYNKGVGAYRTNPQSVSPSVKSKNNGQWQGYILQLWAVRLR